MYTDHANWLIELAHSQENKMLEKSLYVAAMVISLGLTLPVVASDFNEDAAGNQQQYLYAVADNDAQHNKHERGHRRYGGGHHGHGHHRYHVSKDVEMLDHLIVSVIIK